MISPAWLCVSCAMLSSCWRPSALRRRPERTAPVRPASLAAQSAPEPSSLGSGLQGEHPKQRLQPDRMFFRLDFNESPEPQQQARNATAGSVCVCGFTLVCIGAVQFSVQWGDDGGQVRGKAIFPEVHCHGTQELKHTRPLMERDGEITIRSVSFSKNSQTTCICMLY